MSDFKITVLVTLDSKSEEALFICDVLRRGGAQPSIIDLSLRPHEKDWADVSGEEIVAATGSQWDDISTLGRAEAADIMTRGGIKVLLAKYDEGDISGVIGVGGANGATMACTMMRALPPLLPKAMVTPVVATVAVQWHVASSDIVMFPTIGDISLNRITEAVLENAAHAVIGMAAAWTNRKAQPAPERPLVGLSAFGNTQDTIDRITAALTGRGFEIIQFHASGPGGKALEFLAGERELAGVLDLITSEMADNLTGGVYDAGPERLTGAGKAGIPQLVVPGSLDFSNWWAGQVPDKFRNRDFYHYSVENFLMRTNAREFETLGRIIAARLNAASGPVSILVPMRGISGLTDKRASDIDGNDRGPWFEPDSYRPFVEVLEKNFTGGALHKLDLHINDPSFADACVDAFLALMKQSA
jgi:uncharacterized protein (UPF0261 family)